MARKTTYIILFRGVGGATQLPTGPLREALTEAGFENARTYINSGNALVTSDRPRGQVAGQIARIVKERFGFDKKLMLATAAEWARLVKQNPYREAAREPRSLHAFLLEKAPARHAAEALAARAAAHERVTILGKVLYFHAPEGFGTSKLPPVIDKTLGVASTARNWNTVLKLLELAKAPGA
jgi:uncharacterized protein (DUF1697 family)